MSSLAIEYPKEQERLRELIEMYKEIGSAGQFGLVVLQDVLRRADIAAAAHDTVAMIYSFKEMKECE